MSEVPDFLTLIIKVTPGCNLACKYCYMDKSNYDGTQLMSLDVLESIISKAQARCSQINYVWHGGEPLLAGHDYYRYIARLQQFYRRDEHQKIHNSIQTNGTLLNEQTVRTLLAYNFCIGISYDANDPKQSPSRPFLTGRPTEPAVRKRIALLKSMAGSAGVLCVVTRENVEDASGILKRLSDMGLNGVSFLPFKKNPHAPDMGVEPDQWATFLIEVFEFWLENSHSIKNIEPIWSMVLGLMGDTPVLCTYIGPCFKRYLCIYPQGDIYPCSSLVGPEFLLGNIKMHDFAEVFASPVLRQMRIRWLSAVRKHCSHCPYVAFCRGGCPEYAYFEQQDLVVSEDECRSRQRVFSHIAHRLNHLVPRKLLDLVDEPCLSVGMSML